MKTFLAGVVVGVGLTIAGFFGYMQFLYVTPIGDIKGQKATYDGHEVRVRGTVDGSVTIGEVGGYRLEDDTGSIVVLTKTGAPDPDETVTVVGVVDVILGAAVIRPVGDERTEVATDDASTP